MLSFSNSELSHATRLALCLLVENEQRRCGRRDVAFDNIASLIGMSPSWLKKFVRNSGEVSEPRLSLFLKIRAAYNQLCLRIENENTADERRLHNLKEQIDALADRANAKAHTENQTHVRKARGLR